MNKKVTTTIVIVASILATLLIGNALIGSFGSIGRQRLYLAGSSAGAAYDGYQLTSEAPMDAEADFGKDYYDEASDYALDDAQAAYEDVAMESSMARSTALPINVPSIETENRKIVYTVDLSLQTTEFEEGVRQLPEMVESAGGFVQDSYVQGANLGERYYSRSASFTVRVPADKLTAFTDDLGGIFHIVSQQKSSSDISNSYYDTEARLDSLRIQEERLKAMLETADELQYLLEVERELAQVLYEIESMTSSLRRMDSSVNYSTITIHLQEVTIIEDTRPEPKPVTFRDRVGEAFGDSVDGFVSFCQGLVIFLISLIPYLPVYLVIGLLVWLVVRSVRRHLTKRSARAAVSPSSDPPKSDDTPVDTKTNPEQK